MTALPEPTEKTASRLKPLRPAIAVFLVSTALILLGGVLQVQQVGAGIYILSFGLLLQVLSFVLFILLAPKMRR